MRGLEKSLECAKTEPSGDGEGQGRKLGPRVWCEVASRCRDRSPAVGPMAHLDHLPWESARMECGLIRQ